jgi:hypothetical protein
MSSRVAEDLQKWEELYSSGARPDRAPSAWIVSALAALPNDLPLADVAGGTGRHAAPAARALHTVVLIDFVEIAVRRAISRDARIAGVVSTADGLPLRRKAFGTVLVSYFLDRSIFPDLIALLVPGGHLVYETYTLAHHELVVGGLAHGPSSAEFLLRPGELRELAAPLEIVEYWEGEAVDDAGRRCCARMIARKS